MPEQNLITRTAGLVAAYVSHNPVPPADLPAVIGSVHAALSNMAFDRGAAQAGREVPILPTNTEIIASVGHDRIVSFIDGRAYKSLKRHLTANGLTPDRYRAQFNLPKDYPMVSPAYAALRSRIARQIHHGAEAA